MLSILVSLSLIGALAPGAEAREPRPPLIQVGAGAESSNARSIAALVQIRFRGISDNGGDPEAHPATGTFLMRISGDLAVGPRADEAGAWDVPRFNVELTTVTFGVGEEAGARERTLRAILEHLPDRFRARVSRCSSELRSRAHGPPRVVQASLTTNRRPIQPGLGRI